MNKILEIIELCEKSGLKLDIQAHDIVNKDFYKVVEQEKLEIFTDVHCMGAGWQVSDNLSIVLWKK